VVLLRAKCLVKASNKAAFLLSLVAAISLLTGGLALSLPNRLGHTTLLALLLLVGR